MWWPGLWMQRGVHPAPSMGDPHCSGRGHRAPSQGCGAPGVSGTMPVPVGSLPTPGVPGELSARGVHPPARGWGSMAMGTTIHTWSCCVSGPQTDPTALWGRSGPGMFQPSHAAARSSRVLEGSGWWAAGAAGLEMMEGLGGGG